MNLFKYIPKLLPRNSSGVIRCTMNGRFHQKVFLSTAAEATDYAERIDTDQVSLLDLFSIGTSNSPMRASKIFINHLKQHDMLEKVHTLRVDMFGSLTKDTREAILMGIGTDNVRIKDVCAHHSLFLDGTHRIHFNPDRHLVFHHFKTSHPHGLRFCAFDSEANMIATNEFFNSQEDSTLPFKSISDLVQVCKQENKTIAQVVYDHELRSSTPKEVREKLFRIWNAMDDSIKNGVMANAKGVLPGGFRRRAPLLYSSLIKDLYGPIKPKMTYLDSRISLVYKDTEHCQNKSVFLHHLDYLSVYNIAVNEENACGGSIVSFPINITTGIIPSVLKYYIEFISKSPEKDVMEYLLTIAALGTLHRVNNGFSMAAAGFTAIMGGAIEQVEEATKISLELRHDPYENDDLSAVKAIAVSHLALGGSGGSFDQIVKNTREYGLHITSKDVTL